MANQVDIFTNATMSIESGDDRYLPGYEKGLENFGPRLIETRVAFSLYGTAIPYTLGRRRMTGNIIWARELEEKTVTYDAGGRTYTKYGYYGTFAVSFGYNGNAAASDYVLRRVWADGTLIVDNVNTSRAVAPSVRYRFYNGTQLEADETMVAYEGADNVPAYKDQVYMVFVDLPLGNFDNRIPMITVEIEDSNANTTGRLDMTGVSGESSNLAVNVDWLYMRAYVLNSGAFRIYDIDAGTYLRAQEVAGGIDDTPIYLPWLRKMVGSESGLSIYEKYKLVNPENGIVISETPDGIFHQPFKVVAGKYTKSNGDTWSIVATLSQYDDMGIMCINPSGSILKPIHEFGTGFAAASNGICVGGYSTPTEAYIYYSKSSSTLGRCTVPKATVEGLSSATPTLDDSWYAYDGAGSPTSIHHIVRYRRMNGENCLVIFYQGGEVILLDEATKTVFWRNTSLTNVPSSGHGRSMAFQQCDTSGGLLIWDVTGGGISELDLETGLETTYSVTSGWVDGVGIGQGPTKSLLASELINDGLSRIFYTQADGSNLTLATLIKQIAYLGGYEVAEVDVEASVDQAVIGAMLVERTSLQEILEGLRTLFGLEVIESDGTLRVTDRMRNDPTPDFTFDQDDLLQDGAGSPTFTWRQEAEQELPREFKVTYLEADLGYQWASQIFNRSNIDNIVYSDTTNEITVPLIMTATEAKRAAARALLTAWNTSTTFEFAFPKEFLGLEPGDIVQGTVDGYSNKLMRVTNVEYRDDLSMSVTATSFIPWEDLNIAAFAGTAYSPEILTPDLYKLWLFDFPWPARAFSGVEDERIVSAYMLPMSPTTTFTTPGDIFLGSRKNTIRNVGAPSNVAPLPWGYITNDSHGMEYCNGVETMDTETQMNVSMVGGDPTLLSSVTTQSLLEGNVNLAVIGGPGHWELIGYGDVTLELDGTYTFTNLLRGLQNTYPAMMQVILFRYYGPLTTGASLNYSPVIGQLLFAGSGRKGDYFIAVDEDFLQQIEINKDELWCCGAGNSATAKENMEFNPTFNHAAASLPAHVIRVTRDLSNDGLITVEYALTHRNQRTLGDGADPVFDVLPSETDQVILDFLFDDDPDPGASEQAIDRVFSTNGNRGLVWNDSKMAYFTTFTSGFFARTTVGMHQWHGTGYAWEPINLQTQWPLQFSLEAPDTEYDRLFDTEDVMVGGNIYYTQTYSWAQDYNPLFQVLGPIYDATSINLQSYYAITQNNVGFQLEMESLSGHPTLDTANSKFTLTERDFWNAGWRSSLGGTSGFFTEGYFLNRTYIPFALDAYNVTEGLYAATPLTRAGALRMDKVWVSVRRPGGIKKWQLFSIEDI